MALVARSTAATLKNASLSRKAALVGKKVARKAPHINDDRSPLLDLMTCLVCKRTMMLEKGGPDGNGNDLIHYLCNVCDRV
jgi:hypothetical protein